MAHSPPTIHSPDSKRPKGILKNPSSHHRSPTHKPATTFTVDDPQMVTEPESIAPDEATAGHPTQAERDLVLQNTLRNSGRRRSSSGQSARGGSSSRRQSHYEPEELNAEGSPRLKWDEANLYLTEQERTPKMKIDEPKTPFAKGYDPAEDEDELRLLDAEDLIVDELDARPKRNVTPDMNIPDLDLGESEAPKLVRRESHSLKVVVVEDDTTGLQHVSGDNPETPEEEEKHKKFEELRKKHYEMRNVANLLGHPEYLEEEDDDGDVELKDCNNDDDMSTTNGVPAIPSTLPAGFTNGEK